MSNFLSTPVGKYAAIATTVVSASLLAYYFLGKSSSSQSSLEPALSEEETEKILASILEKMKMASLRFLQAFESYKQQLASHGQEMEDRVLMKTAIYPHFKSAFAATQAQVLESFDVDEDELEDATQTYLKRGHAGIEDITVGIKKLYYDFGGDVDLDEEKEAADKLVAGEVTLKTVVDILELIKVNMANATEEYVLTFQDEYGVPQNENDIMLFQQGLMTLSSRAEKEAANFFGLEVPQLHLAIKKYENAPEVGQKMYEMQISAQSTMAKCGIPMM